MSLNKHKKSTNVQLCDDDKAAHILFLEPEKEMLPAKWFGVYRSTAWQVIPSCLGKFYLLFVICYKQDKY